MLWYFASEAMTRREGVNDQLPPACQSSNSSARLTWRSEVKWPPATCHTSVAPEANISEPYSLIIYIYRYIHIAFLGLDFLSIFRCRFPSWAHIQVQRRRGIPRAGPEKSWMWLGVWPPQPVAPPSATRRNCGFWKSTDQVTQKISHTYYTHRHL